MSSSSPQPSGGHSSRNWESATALCVQGQFEHAVVVFYQALLQGVDSQRPDLIAENTALVGAAGQKYREMIAEVNGRLARDHYSREAARVIHHCSVTSVRVEPCSYICKWI